MFDGVLIKCKIYAALNIRVMIEAFLKALCHFSEDRRKRYFLVLQAAISDVIGMWYSRLHHRAQAPHTLMCLSFAFGASL
jgi:hypothetical protein